MRSIPAPRTLIVFASLVLALSLTTGTALARLVFARPPDPALSPTAGPEVALVRGFYAALNTALQTGKTGDLEGIVAVDLVEHAGRPGAPPGLAGLLETLTTLRVTFPALRIEVEDVRSAGDQVTARVRLEGTGGAFLGLPLAAAQVPWGPIDLFRVADGTIAEHWGIPADTARFLPLTQASIPITQQGRQRITLDRRTYASNAVWREEVASGSVLLLGQGGRLSVSITEPASTPALLVHHAAPGADPASEPIGEDVVATLVPGDLLVLPPGARFTTANWDATAAAILVLALEVPVIPGGAPPTDAVAPEGITRQPQATGPAAPIPPDAVVRIGRMTLAPGAELPLHAAAGPELLIVESGTLSLGAGEELAWVRQGTDPGSSGEHLAILQAGDGAMVPPGARASYRNTGPTSTTVLVFTVLPAG